MRNKKHGLTHSQIIGIVWLSIALLLAAAVLFFCRQGGLSPTATTAADSAKTTILVQKEDSVYRLRRGERASKYPSDSYYDKRDSDVRLLSVDSTIKSQSAPAYRRQPLTVELNSADTLTLQLLHGIGPAFARRIVRYRERLGGYRSAEQLLEVYGFTPELLVHIAPHLTVDTTAIHRIPINTVELKQLIKHPYIEYYQARDIVTLRSRGMRFLSADDLRAIPSMSDSTLVRILPYVDFTVVE